MSQSPTFQAKNATGSIIVAGTAVYLSGFDGGYSTIAPASCDSAATMPAIGVVTTDALSNGSIINVQIAGSVAGLDTSAYSVNTTAYVGLNGAIVFSDPYLINTNYTTQQLGTVTSSAQYPYGELELFVAGIVSHGGIGGIAIAASNGTYSAGTVNLVAGANITIGTQTGNAITFSVGIGGGGGMAVSAAGYSVSDGTVIWSNANNLSFGMTGSTITGSVSYPVQTTQTYNVLAAGTQTANSTGTVLFSNANNITFGMSNNSVITGSIANYLTTAMVSNASSNFAGLGTTINNGSMTVNTAGVNISLPNFLTNAVPYTGATANVKLGANSISNTGVSGSADGASFSGGTTSGNGVDGYGTGNGYGGYFSGGAAAIYASGNVLSTGQIVPNSDAYASPTGTTVTINWNGGNFQTLNLNGASGTVAISFSNGQIGASYCLKIIQGNTTPRNVSWTNVKWPSGTAPTISTILQAVDIISFVTDGTIYYGGFLQNMS